MNVPRFESTWSWGTILTVVTSLLGLGVVWGQSRAEVAALASSVTERLETKQETINRINVDLRAVEAMAMTREARIRALELGQGRTEERLIAIQAILARIEQQLRETQ